MILDPQILQLDIKVQSKYREKLASLGTDSNKITCVTLGDSDIDYTVTDARILSSPYQVGGVKHRLLYNGIGKGLSGQINSFVRFVDSDGKVHSLYQYPNTNLLSVGRVVPTLENGYDWNQLTFSSFKMGAIIFFESVLDYYISESGLPEKILEDVEITVLFNDIETVLTGWQVIKDISNRSIFIAKDSIAIDSNTVFPNKIIVVGTTTGITKTITFNS